MFSLSLRYFISYNNILMFNSITIIHGNIHFFESFLRLTLDFLLDNLFEAFLFFCDFLVDLVSCLALFHFNDVFLLLLHTQHISSDVKSLSSYIPPHQLGFAV